jgi:hypothetical protein
VKKQASASPPAAPRPKRSIRIPAVPDTSLPRSEFDRLEDQIRGEQIMSEREERRAKEEREIKRKLEEQEIDRRLEELRKKLGR